MNQHLVVALAYDGLCTFEFGCAVEVFALARPELGVAWYDFAVCAVEEGPIRAAGGITIDAPYTLALLERADTIIIPGWRDPDQAPPAPLLAALQAAAQRGARLCSICSGVFVLAVAGLLDGRAATTHWRYARQLRERYPAIEVQADLLYVDGGQIVSAAGSAAGLDMLLHLVRRDHGARIGNLVAQRLVVQPHREGGQAQFVSRPMAPDQDGRLAALMARVRAEPAFPHTLASMARAAAMSTRTLQRQFQAATGMAPVDWLIRERVAIARDLLESPGLPLPRVAQLAGFGSEESLRRHFRNLLHTSPGAYRKRFAAPPP
ncbi:transcriptional regulator FtrA [Massilia sp. PAMC28688]|uniref:transcriptional regulator FtrA n=1 Tax=Massilia sp. PAMC28688 TaxID=2861283 RepID=UPI001C62E8C4|nr:transcriptional regulator FtrA [Massilia sp. PAMC28688]QYF95577.1 transcriptional regulator FtrA [Massilia sp. PAMC28688]